MCHPNVACFSPQEVLQSERSRQLPATAAVRGSEISATSIESSALSSSEAPFALTNSIFPTLLPPSSLELKEDDAQGSATGSVSTDTTVVAASAASPPAPPVSSLAIGDTFDAEGNPCYVHLPGLRKLFAHITAAVTRHARVWQLYAAVEEASGNSVEADDCRLRCVRRCEPLGGGGGGDIFRVNQVPAVMRGFPFFCCQHAPIPESPPLSCSLMLHPRWASDPEGVAAVCAATGPLVRSLLSRPAAHPERVAGLVRARMHLKSVLSTIEAAETQKEHAAIPAVRGLLDEVLAAEAALAPTASGTSH
jgi:hypothetical protein